MRRKKENIVRHSAVELEALKTTGKTLTDWKAAGSKAVPDGSDPDNAMERVEWSTTKLPLPRRKEHTNLRIDADVLDFFRGLGRGYQTKINAVLRSYVEQVSHRKLR
jgi:uncharacterized protein (DUF4415 family)